MALLNATYIAAEKVFPIQVILNFLSIYFLCQKDRLNFEFWRRQKLILIPRKTEASIFFLNIRTEMSGCRHCQIYIYKSIISEIAIQGKTNSEWSLEFSNIKMCLYFIIQHSTKSLFIFYQAKMRNFLHQIFLFN